MAASNSTNDHIRNQFHDQLAAVDFVRRSNHASLAMASYIYIDGGEIAILVDGKPVNMPNNDTLSIDISKSWTIPGIKFVSINKTSSGVLNLNSGFLIPAANSKSLFQFGGESTNLLYTPRNPTSVSQFTVEGQGNGSWSAFHPRATSGFEHITRPSRALATTVDNTFFILGGVLNSHSADETAAIQGAESYPLDGIVAWNMTSGRWTNESMPSHLIRPNGLNNMLTSVPSFGPAGLLLAAGTGTVDDEAPNFGNITIYEPRDRTWHYQSTTGDIPAGRDRPCTIGIPGDSGTFEIFLYGGQKNQRGGQLLNDQVIQNMDLDPVYILSLPAFAWFRAEHNAIYPRYGHTCHVVANRQMLSIGGLDPLDTGKETMSRDHETYGLGLFDLTRLNWTDEYDANAAPYKTPQIVKDWYRENGTSSVTWNDDAVRSFFRQTVAPKTNSTSDSANPPKASSKPVGAIAGGVIGGVAATCILAALLFWFLRRRRRQSHRDEPEEKNETPDYSIRLPMELSEQERRYEADDYKQFPEADGAQRTELDSSQHAKGPPELM